MPLYVPLLFMGLPVFLVLVFVFVARQHRRVARRCARCRQGWVPAPWPGVVTAEETWVSRHRTAGSTTSAVVHRPIVTYRAASGADVTFRSGLYGTFMPRPGAAVAVFHDPADPDRARIAPESIPKTFRRISAVVWVMVVVILAPLVVVFEGIGWFLLTHR